MTRALVQEQGTATPVRTVRTLVILPAFNEEEALSAVLKELAVTCPQLDVLVVDDGSTDRTAEVARAEGVPVAVLPFNLGVGGALQT
ncbi:MAG TPA: glycosyltransferase, partial [Acidimicrobiales bacterium]|nr:glycosyltransferase [Acidimicrobiales bacterium]